MTTPKLKYPEIKEDTLKEFKDYIEAIISKDNEKINNASESLKKYILSRVEIALNYFYENDLDLLRYGMNEMSVSGRLAMYLQREFKNLEGYYVDTEYYRLRVPLEKVKDLRKDRIRCDILLHARGHFDPRVDNLLAIEIKLEKSDEDGESDMKRLAEFVLPEKSDTPPNAINSTLVGLFLKIGEKGYSSGLFTSLGYTERKKD